MATVQPSQNRVHLFRLQTLIIDGGTTVVRNIIDQKSSNVPLNVLLHQEKTSVNTLRASKVITLAQYKLLYPKGGNPPSISDIDLTLATCLLRSLNCFGLNTTFNWSATPQQTDTSVEADLCRLRNIRNEIAHIACTTGITQATFQSKWIAIEQVLLRLNNSVPNPIHNLQQEIDGYKNNPLDPEAEDKIQDEIDKLQQMEKNLEMEVQIVKKDTAYVKRNVEEVKENVEEVKGNVEEVKENIEEVKGNVEVVKGNVEGVKDSIEVVKEDIAAAHKKIDEESKRRRKTDVSVSVAMERPSLFQIIYAKIRMRRMKKDLKEDLIRFYRQQYHILPLSPLIEDQDTPLLKFYVMPDINSVEIQSSFGGGNVIKSEVTSLRDVFYKKNKKCHEIYLSADAGFGKTAFSKRLVLTWCQAKKRIKSEQKCFEEDDIRAMSEFKFVFLLSLRDCAEECDIDEMIVKQIIPRLANTSVTFSHIQTILSKGKCLLILDGLDEWVHPTSACKQGTSDIPHRKARECTILTTTRPWKLSVISLSSSQIDQKLELVGLNATSAEKLKKTVISLLTGEKDKKKHIQDFNSTIEHKGISDLETVPLLLMYLLCLWYDEVDLGRSKCELYCQIVEMLLKRTCKKYPVMQQASKPHQSDIPQCFIEHVHCKKYYTLLKALGQLAFETLFSDQSESTLVFSQSMTDLYLNAGDLKLCLHSGILTQSKQQKLTKKKFKVSFSHKTVQEYFCALYISYQNESDFQKFVLQRFNSTQNILDMSKVFVFISGMNAEIMSSISHRLMSVISKDQITRRYRSTAGYEFKNLKPLKDIQNMYISCLKENTGNTSLCLQDFIIDKDSQQENYLSHLELLAKHNKINLESICIITGVPSLREIIDWFELHDLVSVKKIYYKGEYKEAEIIRLLTSKCVESVTVFSGAWQDNRLLPEYSPCSTELSKTFQNISQMRAIEIDGFKMEHDVLKEFLNYIINRKSMAEIRLSRLSCVTHDISCEEINLDFSQHSDLRALELKMIPVSQLKVNVSSLEECDVGRLPKPGLLTSFLRELPAASKLHTFKCYYIESSDEIEILLKTLPLLVQLKCVYLCFINLGERSLSLSPEMVNLENVFLLEATLTGSSLRNLVNLVEKLPQSVMIKMHDCNITPETEFADVKKYIKKSENFVVVFDGINELDTYTFVFQTNEVESRAQQFNQ
ncbi:uncharacterized protein LOC123542409 [Mercenaria mercenaria]|uniref:uncharacterized protein LOC123542409 n=1 Tax=Mercenaria mercenaria TaxID=6596 RepID=UPI00234E803A|nr:uncharacterized protein LOC123542409 [Mercenaria mercenaria]